MQLVNTSLAQMSTFSLQRNPNRQVCDNAKNRCSVPPPATRWFVRSPLTAHLAHSRAPDVGLLIEPTPAGQPCRGNMIETTLRPFVLHPQRWQRSGSSSTFEVAADIIAFTPGHGAGTFRGSRKRAYLVTREGHFVDRRCVGSNSLGEKFGPSRAQAAGGAEITLPTGAATSP